MSDYLSHLVERSFAPLPAVRPNTPSRFESSPIKSPVDNATETDLPVDAKTTALPQRHGESPEITPSRFTNPARVSDQNAHGQFTEHRLVGAPEKISSKTAAPVSPAVAVPTPSQNSSLVPREIEVPIRSSATPPRTIRPIDNADAPAQDVDAESRFSAEIRPNTASTKDTLRLNGTRSVSPVVRKENGQPTSRETSARPSTIHVSIGRVEIKATPPPSAPSRTASRKNPSLSLENYLQRRSSGGRDE